MIGRVLEVYDERLGGEVLTSAVLDDTTLVVDDASDFEEDGGTAVGSSAVTVDYTAADYATNTLTLDAAMSVPQAAAFQEGDWAAPYSHDHEDSVRMASVDVGDGPELIAVVNHALRPYFPPGARRPGEQEVVEVGVIEGEARVLNIRGRKPGLVGPSIDVPERGEFGVHVAVDGTIGLGGINEADAAIVVLYDGSQIEINSPLNLGGLGFVHGVYVDMQAFTVAPDSPPAGLGRLYVWDSGTKLSLRIKFPTGVAQVIATEP